MIIKNKILPPKGFSAIAIYPFIFIRKNKVLSDIDINHEKIHHAQQKELIILGIILSLLLSLWYFQLLYFIPLIAYSLFYILYSGFYIFQGYWKAPFEIEAYKNQDNLNYLKNRKSFAWRKYI